MAKLELPADDLAVLRRVLYQFVPHAEVWGYGSRVTGGAHSGSDLDLIVRNPRSLQTPQSNLSGLRAALTESDLPIRVDVLDWARTPKISSARSRRPTSLSSLHKNNRLLCTRHIKHRADANPDSITAHTRPAARGHFAIGALRH